MLKALVRIQNYLATTTTLNPRENSTISEPMDIELLNINETNFKEKIDSEWFRPNRNETTDLQKNAFSTDGGHYDFKRMPFENALSTF